MLKRMLVTFAGRLALLVVVSIVAHAIVHLAPGEPSEVDPTNPRMKPEDVALIRAAFHLDEPLHRQYKGLLGALGDWDFTADVRAVAAPTLVVHGEHDPVPERGMDAWLEALPNAARARIDGSARMPWLERPQAFFEALEGLFASVP